MGRTCIKGKKFLVINDENECFQFDDKQSALKELEGQLAEHEDPETAVDDFEFLEVNVIKQYHIEPYVTRNVQVILHEKK